MATLNYMTPGTFYWTCPPGCFTVDVTCRGSGGNGGYRGLRTVAVAVAAAEGTPKRPAWR